MLALGGMGEAGANMLAREGRETFKDCFGSRMERAAGRGAQAGLPNAAGFLGVHGLAFGALKRLAELVEVLGGVIHAHLSR